MGIEGQERIAAATVALVGADLAIEVVARALAAGGVGRLRLIRGPDDQPSAVLLAALRASNPELEVAVGPWPTDPVEESGEQGRHEDAGSRRAQRRGEAWLTAITRAAVVVRSGFDDNALLPAAVRLAIPLVAMRGRSDVVDVVSFRRHGPCPHLSLDVVEQRGTPPEDGAEAVVAGHLAAAEVLALLAGATTGPGRGRHVRIPFAVQGVAADDHGRSTEANAGADSPRPGELAIRATDIPWSPECFACGGSSREMSFS